MFFYVYRQFSWPCHPIRTNNSTGNVIQFVSTTQLAITSWLYQPLYWVGHPICTDHSNGHVILSVLTPLTGHVILSLPTTYGPCHPICINHSSDHIILSVPGLHKIKLVSGIAIFTNLAADLENGTIHTILDGVKFSGFG